MDSHTAPITHPPQQPGQSVDDIKLWIINRLARELRIKPEELTGAVSILSLGVDSVQVVSIMSELEDWGEFRFPANPLEDDVTIDELALHVADLTGKKP